MAFARKADPILAMRPDIVIVQECSERDARSSGAHTAFWTGRNIHKGLAVLIYATARASLHPCATTSLPWFLPVTIENTFNLLAIWACVKSWKTRYVRLSHLILDRCAAFLDAPLSIAAGDFNSNSIWDDEHGDLSHSCLVTRLNALGLDSAYHSLTGERHGQESRPTQFQYRHADKAYHLDYIFATTSLLDNASVDVGDHAVWLSMSDHMPLVLDLPDGFAGNWNGRQ